MEQQPKAPQPMVNAGLSLAGAATGGVLGYLAFGWLAAQGFYALALPGVLLGLDVGVLAKRRSMALAAGCGVPALALGVFAQWKHFPFIKDDSLAYFLPHLTDLRPFTLISIGLGGFGGFWFARPVAKPRPPPANENPTL